MMVEEHDQSLLSDCAAAVSRLVARYHSRLLPDSVLRHITQLAMRSRSFPSAYHAAMHVYALALYSACAPEAAIGDPHDEILAMIGYEIDQAHRSKEALLELGYTELHAYLFAIAQYRYPELQEDVAQTAILHVFTKFAHCRVPGAFLKFAILQLAIAARAIVRREAHVAASLDVPLLLDESLTLGQLLVDEEATLPFDVVENASVREQLAQALAQCIRRHPRAKLQLAAVWMKYIEELDDVLIGERLHKSVASVHVARSRGLALLAAQAEFQQLAAELGISGGGW
jgi:DNA-directed RNA polymerase specialized sigma24 family protein